MDRSKPRGERSQWERETLDYWIANRRQVLDRAPGLGLFTPDETGRVAAAQQALTSGDIGSFYITLNTYRDILFVDSGQNGCDKILRSLADLYDSSGVVNRSEYRELVAFLRGKEARQAQRKNLEHQRKELEQADVTTAEQKMRGSIAARQSEQLAFLRQELDGDWVENRMKKGGSTFNGNLFSILPREEIEQLRTRIEQKARASNVKEIVIAQQLATIDGVLRASEEEERADFHQTTVQAGKKASTGQIFN